MLFLRKRNVVETKESVIILSSSLSRRRSLSFPEIVTIGFPRVTLQARSMSVFWAKVCTKTRFQSSKEPTRATVTDAEEID